MKTLILLLISFSCFAQSDPTITVEQGATKKEIHISVKKSEVKHPPIIAVEGGTADPQVISTMWSKNDSLYYATITLIYLNLEPDTITIPASKFISQGGTSQDTGANAGNIGVKVNGDIVEFYNVGDWLKYSVNLTGKKNIRLRYSYGLTLTDRKLEVRTGSITGPLIAEMTARPTGNWATFVDHVIPITSDTRSAGIQELFFVVSGSAGTNYWGNLMGEIWFY